MACEGLHNIVELKYLWKSRGNKNYILKNFQTSDGLSVRYVVFEDLQNRRNVFGKIVIDPREGEAYHWPRLQHENLAPLLDRVALSEIVSIYIFPAFNFSLKTVIHDENFKIDSESFNRKRNYVKDILLALEYLHSKSLCIMNLTERLFFVSDASDKAILGNFECVHLIGRVTKEDLNLPVLYQAPELKTEYFDPFSVESWACGIMFLQIFTNDFLPSAFIGDEVKSALEAVKEINYDIIKEANYGAKINAILIEELRSFLNLFLVEDPKLRVDVRKASTSDFLKSSRRAEIKDNFKSTLWKSSGFDPCAILDNSECVDFSHKKTLFSPFEDIYLKEKANCKSKIKSISSTNKFINLKFIPQGDNTTKHFVMNDFKKIENKVGASDENKHKFVADQTPSSELNSDDADKKSTECIEGDYKTVSIASECVKNIKRLSNIPNPTWEDKSIGDNKIVPIPEFLENFKSGNAFNNNSNSNLENPTNSLEHAIGIYHNSKDDTGDKKALPLPSECGENLTTLSVSNNTCNSNTNGIVADKPIYDDIIIPTPFKLAKNFNHTNPFNQTSNSSIETELNNSGDKMENVAANEIPYDDVSAFQNIEKVVKSSANEVTAHETKNSSEATLQISRSPSDSDISLDSLELANNNLEQASSTCREHESNSIGSDKSISSDSKTHPNTVNFCALDDGTSLCLKIVHMNSVFNTKKAFEQNLVTDKELCSDSSIKISTEVNNNSKYSTSIENKKENNHQSHQIQGIYKNETAMLKANVGAFSQTIALDDRVMPNIHELKDTKDALIYDEVHKTGDNSRNLVETSKEDKAENIPHDNSQDMQQVDLSLSTNDNHEETVNNQTHVHTEKGKLKTKKKRSFMKIPFFHKKSTEAKKNIENNDVEPKKVENNMPILENVGNMQVDQNTNSLKKYLLKPLPEEEIGKVKKRKWIRFFCPGSK